MHSLPVNIQWFWRFLAGVWDQGHLTEITGLTLCKGPINLGQSICTSIFYHSIFLRIGSSVFLYCTFWGTVSTQNWWTDGVKFLGKILACAKMGQKGLKWSYLSFCRLRQYFFLTNGSVDFPHILHEVEGP